MRLLILGAGRDSVGLLQTARARGLYVIAADRDPGAPGFRLADRRAILALGDEPALERLAEAERVGAVLATTPAAVGAAARIAERYRLPHPISAESAVVVGSRLRQRERLAAAGVPQTRWQVVRHPGETPGFPHVVQPPDRRGRRLAEETPSGVEATVVAFSEDGTFHGLAGPAAALPLAERAAAALGIGHGVTSTRVQLGLGGLRVAEVRTCVDDREAALCRRTLGIDLYALVLAAALGDDCVRFGTADAQAIA
jgi:hypothetical protein